MNTQQFLEIFPTAKPNEPLSKHTTIKVGGPADIYFEAKSKDEFVSAIKFAHKNNIPITILGWGSNVIISDKGIRGLVVVNRSSEISILDKEEAKFDPIETTEVTEETLARLDQLQPEIYGKFDDLDYDETNLPTSTIYMDAGVSLPLAILKTIKADLTGMQWFAGIPGTIGGAIYNNIHGGTHFFFEIVESVEVLDKKTFETRTMNLKDLEGGYDKSIFHETNDYILSANLKLYNGDSEKALKVMQEWRRRKKIQPQISAGCTWQNLSEEQKAKLNLPSSSIGYLIEHVLKLKGEKKGNATISDKHAAFIENLGGATAEDILFLMKKIYHKAEDELGIELKPEIFLLGFEKEEIKEFL